MLAAWFHDTGHSHCYSGHEVESAVLAEKFLISKGLNKNRVSAIKELILSTRLEVKPGNLLEEILHDADIQHIGKKNFYRKGQLLRDEWRLILHKNFTDQEWEFMQYRFLTLSRFITQYASEKLGPGRAKNIEDQAKKVKKILHKQAENPNMEKTGGGTETMYRVTYRNHINLSAIADKKANMMMSINSIILSAIIAVVGSGFAFIGGQDVEYYRFGIPIGILLLTSLGSVIFAILSAKPKVTHNLPEDFVISDRKSSVLYFGNFTSLPLMDFLSNLEILRGDNHLLYDNMSIDIYFLGQVLKKKYKLLQFSYSVFMVGLILAVVALIFILFYSKYISTHPIF